MWLTQIILKHTVMSNFGLRSLKDFTCSIYIGDILEQKRNALAQHKSQVTRLIDDPRWSTLNDVSNRQFLQQFFREREVFQRYEHSTT